MPWKKRKNIRPKVEKFYLGLAIMDTTYNYTSDGPTYFLHWWLNFQLPKLSYQSISIWNIFESMQYGIYWIMGVLHWLIGEFWLVGSIPLYAHKLLSEPNGRSVWQIINNPEGAYNHPKRVKQHIYRCYNIKKHKYLPRIPSKLFVHSC